MLHLHQHTILAANGVPVSRPLLSIDSARRLMIISVSACGGAVVPPPTTTTTTSSGPTTTPGGGCAGIAPWSSSTVYVKDMQAVYRLGPSPLDCDYQLTITALIYGQPSGGHRETRLEVS